MHKNRNLFFTILLILLICSPKTIAAEQILSATLGESEPVVPSGSGGSGGGGLSTGSIVGIAVGSAGGATAGATALAFAPILLAGLEPNSVVSAAAPLQFIVIRANYLENAINYYSGIKITKDGFVKSEDKFYFAQNDSDIINGTYDIDEIILPEELKAASRLKINVTIVSDPYNEINGEPELSMGIYKDITRVNLNKKFETQQFLHHYLMKKYDIPMNFTYKDYSHGIQKLSGIIDMTKFQFKNQPLQVAIKYTRGGFHTNLRKEDPKILTYAYLIEFVK